MHDRHVAWYTIARIHGLAVCSYSSLLTALMLHLVQRQRDRTGRGTHPFRPLLAVPNLRPLYRLSRYLLLRKTFYNLLNNRATDTPCGDIMVSTKICSSINTPVCQTRRQTAAVVNRARPSSHRWCRKLLKTQCDHRLSRIFLAGSDLTNLWSASRLIFGLTRNSVLRALNS